MIEVHDPAVLRAGGYDAGWPAGLVTYFSMAKTILRLSTVAARERRNK